MPRLMPSMTWGRLVGQALFLVAHHTVGQGQARTAKSRAPRPIRSGEPSPEEGRLGQVEIFADRASTPAGAAYQDFGGFGVALAEVDFRPLDFALCLTGPAAPHRRTRRRRGRRAGQTAPRCRAWTLRSVHGRDEGLAPASSRQWTAPPSTRISPTDQASPGGCSGGTRRVGGAGQAVGDVLPVEAAPWASLRTWPASPASCTLAMATRRRRRSACAHRHRAASRPRAAARQPP